MSPTNVDAQEFLRKHLLPSVRKQEDWHRVDHVPYVEHAGSEERIWRYMSVVRLFQLLLSDQLWFSVPSELGHMDPLDGQPDERLAQADADLAFESLFDAREQSILRSIVSWTCVRRIVRNSVRVSCWTYGGESYAMWKSYADLEWGVCLCIPFERAKKWAEEERLDFGPVQYLPAECEPGQQKKRINLNTPVRLNDAFKVSEDEPSDLCKAPLQWVKSSFFYTEFEFRFGKRQPEEQLRCDLRASARKFEAVAVPFDAFEIVGGSSGAIVTGPHAPNWYRVFVSESVREIQELRRKKTSIPVRASSGRSVCD